MNERLKSIGLALAIAVIVFLSFFLSFKIAELHKIINEPVKAQQTLTEEDVVEAIKKYQIVVEDGKNGEDGRDGLDGRSGADGKDGKDGKDGEDSVSKETTIIEQQPLEGTAGREIELRVNTLGDDDPSNDRLEQRYKGTLLWKVVPVL